MTNKINSKLGIIPVLDIGSGTNPFVFRYPDAWTIDHPLARLECTDAAGNSSWCRPSDPHVYLDVRAGVNLPTASVRRVVMHYVIGEGRCGVIQAEDSYALFASIHSALVPGGMLYIRSVFRQHHNRGIDVIPFCSSLLAAGFCLKDIDFIPSQSPDMDSFCSSIMAESHQFDEMPVGHRDESSFIVAEK